jgi:hypothetical protein
MSESVNHKKDKPIVVGEVNHDLLPKITSDEIDLEVVSRD